MASKFKRTYLNSEEKNLFMVSRAFIEMLDGERNLNGRRTEEVWTEWEKRGMITPAMKKNLKMVRTYLKKFCDEVEENLDETEIKKLHKQLMKFDFKLIDDYTLQKLFRDLNDRMKYVVMERDKFAEIVEDIAQVRCVGCTDDYRSCVIYKALDDISTKYLGEQPNCPYAADLSKCSEERKVNINKLKENMRKKNKFYKG